MTGDLFLDDQRRGLGVAVGDSVGGGVYLANTVAATCVGCWHVWNRAAIGRTLIATRQVLGSGVVGHEEPVQGWGVAGGEAKELVDLGAVLDGRLDVGDPAIWGGC